MRGINFQHRMGAHCETATISSLLRYYGYSISEAMILGITGGIFFAYIDSPKFAFPTIVTRSKPGDIRKKIFKRVNADYCLKRFRNPDTAMDNLNRLLDQNIPVAVQVDMFYMEYVPQYMKVHFNGHFVIVTGRENGSYFVSDAAFPAITTIGESALKRDGSQKVIWLQRD
ncbi:MAG: BtrH N-terminal domain-containing protein [Chitinispirillia bacterium]